MRTILLVTGGSLGDIRPFLSIAEALSARGVQPMVITTPAMRMEVERRNIPCRTVGRDVTIEQILRERPAYMSLRGGPLVLKEMFIPASRDLYNTTVQVLEETQADCVVAHPGCFGSIWAAQQRRCPLAVVHLAPASLFQAEDAAAAAGLPAWMMKPVMSMGVWLANRWFRDMAKSIGVPWDRTLLRRTMHGGDVLLGLWSPSFRAVTKHDSTHLHVCGFPRPAVVETLPEELSVWLDNTEPPIIFGLGSTGVHVAGHILDKAPEICRRLNQPGVVIGGPKRGTRFRDNIAILPYASFDALFPRAAAIVHHGGIGTTLAALRSGRPSLALPFGHDQFDNGARLRVLGVGQRLWQHCATKGAITRKLRNLLLPHVQNAAQAFADVLRRETDGAVVAVDAILHLKRNL